MPKPKAHLSNNWKQQMKIYKKNTEEAKFTEKQKECMLIVAQTGFNIVREMKLAKAIKDQGRDIMKVAPCIWCICAIYEAITIAYSERNITDKDYYHLLDTAIEIIKISIKNNFEYREEVGFSLVEELTNKCKVKGLFMTDYYNERSLHCLAKNPKKEDEYVGFILFKECTDAKKLSEYLQRDTDANYITFACIDKEHRGERLFPSIVSSILINSGKDMIIEVENDNSSMIKSLSYLDAKPIKDTSAHSKLYYIENNFVRDE